MKWLNKSFLAVYGEGVYRRRKHQGHINKTLQPLSILLLLCHTTDCICNIRIRVSGYLVSALSVKSLKAIVTLLLLQIYSLFFCISYFPNGNLWSCPGFAASPFDKLFGQSAYNQSQLMLFCVSLHAYLAFLHLTVLGSSCLKIVSCSSFVPTSSICGFLFVLTCLMHHLV